MSTQQIDLSAVLGALKVAATEAVEAAMAGLVDGGEHVLQVSSTLVPLDTADLERSGTINEDQANRRVAISYDTPYAVEQHEDLTFHHKNGRQAKYLESAHVSERDVVSGLVADRVRTTLGGRS
jgi:hypothetical protein